MELLFWCLLFAFQAWMLVDALQREEWLWALIMGLSLFVFKTYGISAILYYFLVYRVAGPAAGGGWTIPKLEIPGTERRRRMRELELRIGEMDRAHHHAELGELHEADGDSGRAEACYRAAVEREPDDPDYRAKLGRVLASTGRAGEAIPLLQAVCGQDIDHDYGQTLLLLARLEADAGREGNAAASLEKLLERHSYAMAKVQLAELYARQGRTVEARDLLEEVIREYEAAPRFQQERERAERRRAEQALRALPDPMA